MVLQTPCTGWIFKAEQFFDLYDITDPDRVNIAAIHMEGEVIPWFQLWEKCEELVSWSSLAKALKLAYGPSLFESPSYNRRILFPITISHSLILLVRLRDYLLRL